VCAKAGPLTRLTAAGFITHAHHRVGHACIAKRRSEARTRAERRVLGVLELHLTHSSFLACVRPELQSSVSDQSALARLNQQCRLI
jgi:hypothetical protein